MFQLVRQRRTAGEAAAASPPGARGHERPVYCDGWFPRQHCYHPSLPPRRLRMVEELAELGSTLLLWAGLGGGSLALPHLEQEAFGEIDQRFRFYGFLNDSEFVAACHERGIDVFGVLFEAQGWRFPAELDETGTRVLALNELRGVGRRVDLGLSAFSTNAQPQLWPAFESYFPDGLTGADGEPVHDLVEEAVCRDVEGGPLHAEWVESPDREHECFLMCRSNPAWRSYLKKAIEIQVAAGVDGVLLDEAETPLTAVPRGGCFCRACTGGFRAYLQALPAEELSAELASVDLEAFDYGAFLRERGHDLRSTRTSAPLFAHYLRYQRAAVAAGFHELAEHVRAAGRERQGREIRVSGNFFDLEPVYHALAADVDVVVSEQRQTGYRQPAWYRYAAGFAAGKQLIVVENPYGGIVGDLQTKLAEGRGHDLYRLWIYEAAALGARMSTPYGAWTGSVEEDPLWIPQRLAVETARFIARHEPLYGAETANETALVYPVASALAAEERHERLDGFWRAARALADAAEPYDVLVLPDGVLRRDLPELERLSRYRTLVLCECERMPAEQVDLLAEYRACGGRIVVCGADGAADCTPEQILSALPDGRQCRLAAPEGPIAVNLQLCERGGIAVHLVNYGYDEGADRVLPVAPLAVSLRLPAGLRSARLHAPGRQRCQLELDERGGLYSFSLDSLDAYAIVELAP